MSDGMFVHPLLNGDRITGWTRGDCIIVGAAHFKELGTDLRFLRYVDGEVVLIPQEEQDAILAQDELDKAQAIADAAAQAEAAANAPFEVSKFKLCMAFQQSGKLADFMAFIEADAEMAFLWQAAQVLDSDNPMVLAALSQISNLLPEGCNHRDFLLQCRA